MSCIWKMEFSYRDVPYVPCDEWPPACSTWLSAPTLADQIVVA